MFRHVGIVVQDVDRQLKFYRDLIGLEIYYEKIEKGYFLENLIGIPNACPKIYKLGKDGKILVELLYFENIIKSEKKSLNSNGITHFAITVEGIEELYKKLLSNSVKFINPPSVSDDGFHKVCFCQDFEENYIELVEKIK